MNTPCFVHKYYLVSNPYKNGKLSPNNFVGAEWVAEKVCRVCGVSLPPLPVKE